MTSRYADEPSTAPSKLMKEKIRDKTRDNLAHALNSLGVQAEIADRGRVEEKVHNAWWNRSLGVIDLPEGPVRWINVIKKDPSKESPPMWWINFCIPDERPISGNREIDVKTVRKKTFPLFGQVIGVDWKGKDHSTGLVNRLSYDQSAKDLATRTGNIRIRSYSKEFQGWTVQVAARFEPTRQDWQIIQKIADYLLSAPRV